MKHAGDEEYLIGAAKSALGDEEVLAAGIFGWQDLVKAQVLGGTAGAVVGDLATESAAGTGIAAAVSGRLATEAMAAEHGMTTALLGIVTPTTFRILNWDGETAGDETLAFDRHTTEVHISRIGLSKIVQLHDTASGAQIKLHATAAPFLSQSKPDNLVLHLLAAPE